jgi:hypothetical protein
MLLWFIELSLGCCKIIYILRHGGICGMESYFDSALDEPCDMIPIFDFSSFNSKFTADVPLKPNMFWRVPCLVKLLRIWKLTFN